LVAGKRGKGRPKKKPEAAVVIKVRKSRRGNKNAVKPAPEGGSELQIPDIVDDESPSEMVLSSIAQPVVPNSPTSAENVQPTRLDDVASSFLATKQTNPNHDKSLEEGASCSSTAIVPSWPEACTSELEYRDPSVSSCDHIPALSLIFKRVPCLLHLV